MGEARKWLLAAAALLGTAWMAGGLFRHDAPPPAAKPDVRPKDPEKPKAPRRPLRPH